jgi:ELWxxDGT repeat protein
MRSTAAFTVASILAGVTGARAQAPYLVKDVNPVANLAAPSDPRHVRAGTDLAYFVATVGDASRGFWRTGGTPASTSLILDALSGAEPQVTTIGNIGLFAFADASSGIELWRTDGTPAGTALVRDINPGTAHSSPSQLTAAGGLAYFLADGGTGIGLWRSDGTSAGTVALVSGQASSFQAAGSLLYFVKSLPATGAELWRSDGTVGGTFMLTDACPGTCSSSPQNLTAVGDSLYYSAIDPTHGRELWLTDGTPANTALVVELAPANLSPQFTYMAASGSALLFTTDFPQALWRTTGTAVSTEIIAMLQARDLTTVGTDVFFRASTPGTGSELWRSDGTAAGTAMVADLCPGACGFFDTAISPSFVGSPQLLYFLRFDGTKTDLWRSDGTAGGTFMVKESAIGNQVPAVLATSLLFAAESSLSGSELWTSDGTVAGTVQLTERVANSSDPSEPTIAGNRMFFQAREAASGNDLWVTEGTEATTFPLDVSPGPGAAILLRPAALGSAFLSDIALTPPAAPSGLWTSDGTPAGTTFVQPLFNVTTPAPLGSSALLLAAEFFFDYKLWKTDGTPAGTTLVKDFTPDGTTNDGRCLPVLGGTGFLSVVGPSDTTGFWRSDGTTDGTLRVASFTPSEGAALDGALILSVFSELWRSDGWPQGTALLSPDPYDVLCLKATSGRAFFTARTASAGRELWVTDGTPAGTTMVRDIMPGPGSAFSEDLSCPSPLVELNGAVYFFARDFTHGTELWRSDGTAAGTVLVADMAPGLDAVVTDTSALTAAGGRLWFQGYTQAEGRELWTSDGTAAGTTLFADIAPGPYSSRPDQFRSDGRRLYLFADDGVHGTEPWALDLAPTLSVEDVTVVEGDGTPGVASFAVRLSSPTALPVTVAYATADGSAHAGSDYQPGSGMLTFPPGPAQTLQVDVPLVADLEDEPEEAFVLRLSSPVQAVVADADGVALIHDDDAPQLLVQGVSVQEGDAGQTPAVIGVSLVTKNGAPTTLPKTVQFATEPGSATSGVDYLPASGTLTFAAGTASGSPTPVEVAVVGDTLDEPDELFQLRVVAASAVQPATVTAAAVIVDDDGGPSGPAIELGHGSALPGTFAGASSRTYRLLQQPHSSYEVRIDETSGDAQPVQLERLAPGGTTVVQSGVADGTGGSVVLRWENASSAAVGGEGLRVASPACGTSCGADDTYRIRAYDATLRGPRFNNAGSQRTVLILQNRTALVVQAHLAYWREDGTLAAWPSLDLQARETRVLDTAQAVPGQSGSLTISHTAGYGGLAGKVVALEPSTGFSFDTPLTYRPR